jgi:hypothetical protein
VKQPYKYIIVRYPNLFSNQGHGIVRLQKQDFGFLNPMILNVVNETHAGMLLQAADKRLQFAFAERLGNRLAR